VDRVVIPIYIFKNGNDEHLCPELLHADVTSKMVQNATGFHVEVLNVMLETVDLSYEEPLALESVDHCGVHFGEFF